MDSLLKKRSIRKEWLPVYIVFVHIFSDIWSILNYVPFDLGNGATSADMILCEQLFQKLNYSRKQMDIFVRVSLVSPLYTQGTFLDLFYNGVIMSAKESQIISLTIGYSTVYTGADERKHQSSASLAFVRGIHRWPVNSPHNGPVTRKRF